MLNKYSNKQILNMKQYNNLDNLILTEKTFTYDSSNMSEDEINELYLQILENKPIIDDKVLKVE